MALTKVSGNVIQDGIVISGIITATEFEGNLTGTASTATASSTAYGLSGAPDIVVGITTATGFVGNITGNVTGNVTGDINAGIITATSITGVSTAGITTAYIGSINDGPLSGARNRIINGDMRIDQRFDGTAATFGVGAAYVLDRWTGAATIGSNMRVQQVTDAPAGFTNSQKVDALTGATITSSDYFVLLQSIEGLNFSDLSFGTATASSITLSFWVRSSVTGTHSGSLRNAAENRSYPYTYTISSADTWEKKTIVIPGDTSGTWLTNNGIGVQIIFDLGTGSTFRGTAGAWAGANYIGATGAVSPLATSGATWYITGVQLEAGSVATPFERRSYGQELLLCQRYFLRSNWVLCTSITGLNYRKINPGPNVTMRTSPDHVYRHPVTKTVNQVREHSSGSTYTIDESSSANSNGPSPTTYLGLSATPTYDVQVEIDYSAEL
jgi:hypothetical protein